MTGASPRENERSGVEEDVIKEPGKISGCFLMSLSSFVAREGPAIERLDEPDVETVESDEEEGWEGCPLRA